MKLFYAHDETPNLFHIEEKDQPLPGMELLCSAEHMGWYCASVAHPENPDQHYYVHR